MKRLILLIICISFCLDALADPVTPQQAAGKAESFLSGGIRTKSGTSVKLVWTWPEMKTKAGNGDDPLLYVFEREGGGFAIVSGEDAAHPILGYSATGSFSTSDMPDNLRGLLNWYGEVLQCARDNHWAASPELREEWNRGMTLADLKNEKSAQLETAQWNQWSPYNDLCPIIDGHRCPSGCVATATAIIMHYHQWPFRGTGELPSYDYDYLGVKGHVDGYSLGNEYQWDNMPMKMPESGYTKEQSHQIAQLLYDVGVMSYMMYTPSASASSILASARGLIDYFNYDNSMWYAQRTDYFYSWEELVREEIDNNRPVLYSATSQDGVGHAIVIDGYGGDHFFSINFGWGGNSNGLFRLTLLDGHENEMIHYYQNQVMVGMIRPVQNNDNTDWVVFIPSTPCSFSDYYGDFVYTIYLWALKIDFSSSSYDFCLGHFSNTSELIEIVTDPKEETLIEPGSNGYCVDFSRGAIHFNNAINDGDQMKLLYRKHGNKEWRLLDNETRRSYIVFDRNTPISQRITFGIASPLSNEERSRELISIFNNLDDFSLYEPLFEKSPIELRITGDVSNIRLFNYSKGMGMGGIEQRANKFGQVYMNKGDDDYYIAGYYLSDKTDDIESSYKFWLFPGDYYFEIKTLDEKIRIRFSL